MSVSETLSRAKTAFSTGNTEGARDGLIQLLAEFPKNSKALSLLSEVMARRLGLPPRPFAEQHFRRLVTARGSFGAAAVAPDALALAMLNPSAAPALSLSAGLLSEVGADDLALRQFRAALALDPRQAELHYNHGALLLRLNRPGPAAEAFRRAVTLKPELLPGWRMLGSALDAQKNHAAAAEAYGKAKALAPEDAETAYLLGTALTESGDMDSGLPELERATRLDPNHARAFNNLGNMRLALGDKAGAVQALRAAAALAPESGITCYNLARALKFTPETPELAAMHKLAERSLPPDEKIALHFALAKALEDIGADDESFAHLTEGSRLRRGQLNYSAAATSELFRRFAEAFSPEAPAARPTPAPVTPIFVLGMMRSGTSLTEQMLSAHSQVAGAGELDTLNVLLEREMPDLTVTDSALTRLRDDYLAELARLAQGRAFVVDKMPANFRLIGLIRKALPEAKIIHMQRDPVAVSWSIYKTYFPSLQAGWTFDMTELTAYYDDYLALMAEWRRLYPGEFLDLDYQWLTEQPRAAMEKVLGFCGLPFEEACLAPQENTRAVKTASMLQVRSGIYTGSSEAWRRWEKHIGPLVQHFSR